MQKYDTVRQLPDERIGLGRFYLLPVLVQAPPATAELNMENRFLRMVPLAYGETSVNRAGQIATAIAMRAAADTPYSS
jgi:hypothetical protein